ncbi:MAG: hypothetical protein JST54_25445 [Deltaproteobacteria bacterium]|nr:hypothetical protein [Deltaproteobacteria bacterium]
MRLMMVVFALFALLPSAHASSTLKDKAVKRVAAADAKKPEPAKPEPAKAEAAKPEAKADDKGGDAKEDAKGDDAPPNPVRVKVGTYVLNIGKFEVATGTYTVDFYLDLTSIDGRPLGEQKFEFMNGRAASVDKIIDTETEKFYRIQANLMTNVDMRRYPWDTHDLPIILENSSRSKKEVVYEVDTKQSGIDPAVNFVGWDLKGYDASVVDHNYAVYGESYSQYVYKIEIGRLLFISSLKTFLPVLCFLLISMVSLLVTLEKLDSRMGMNTAMLIASVMFHMSIGSQLPPAGYLTIADKVMIATYGTIGVNLLLSVLMMRAIQLKREDWAKMMRERSFKLVPFMACLAYLVVVMS